MFRTTDNTTLFAAYDRAWFMTDQTVNGQTPIMLDGEYIGTVNRVGLCCYTINELPRDPDNRVTYVSTYAAMQGVVRAHYGMVDQRRNRPFYTPLPFDGSTTL